MNYYNSKEILKIRSFKKNLSINFAYLDEQKFLGFKIKKAGIYFISAFNVSPASDDDLKGYIVENNKVYNKPVCIVYFKGDSCKYFRFDTYREAQEKAARIVSKCPNINWIEL